MVFPNFVALSLIFAISRLVFAGLLDWLFWLSHHWKIVETEPFGNFPVVGSWPRLA